MKRSLIHKILACALLLGTALASCGLGCVDNNVSLFIRQVQVPDENDDCLVQNDPNGLVRLSGRMDTALTTSYQAVLLLGNQLVQRGDADTLRPESNRVQIYEIEVSIFDYLGNELRTFTQPASGFVDPATNTTPGWGLVGATLIDPATGQSLAALNQTVVSRVKVYGVTLGGLEVETGYWDFPIYVCQSQSLEDRSCLPCDDPENPTDDIIYPCFYGQDTVYDCRLSPFY